MAVTPKGTKSAAKHVAHPQGRGPGAAATTALASDDPQVRKATFAMLRLESAIDVIYERLLQAEGTEFARLASTLSQTSTALFNGHRTLHYLAAGMTPMEDALKELTELDFDED